VRAFRPGRYGAATDDEEVEQIKQARMQVYAVRAKAKLPLFEDVMATSEPKQQDSPHGGSSVSA
jgi:hypothetical protein